MNEQLKKIQKDTGIKMGQYDNEKNRLYNQGKLLIKAIESYIKQIELLDMTSEQMFLDTLDKLNELSVKY